MLKLLRNEVTLKLRILVRDQDDMLNNECVKSPKSRFIPKFILPEYCQTQPKLKL